MYLEIDDFSWGYFILVAIITFVSFFWIFNRSSRKKLYVIPFIIFFFAYSGAGVAWDGCEKEYLWYYSLWIIFFSITLSIVLGRKKEDSIEGRESVTTSFVIRNADFFIYLYILIALVSLAFSGNLSNLISPPPPDLSGVMDQVASGKGEGGLLYYLKHIVFVFYFVSLYKYRNHLFKLFLFMFLPFYITYANTAYMARSTIMAYLIIYFIAIYYYNPHIRKKIRLFLFIGLPFIIIGLSFYTFIRLGRDVDISAGDSIKLLAYQETHFPNHYTLMKNLPFDWSLFKDYWEWLFTLPLPGFLKDPSKDFFFNAIFTERIYGRMRGTAEFSVSLPGVVGEGIFIFGRYFLVLHAIVLGLFVGTTYRIVKSKYEFFMFLYCSIFSASLIARAGTVSGYPMYLKSLLIYEIIVYWVARKNSHRKKITINS